MAYQSLYRKYRPQTFADVMGQGHVTQTLQNALRSGRVAHGYLFTGTRGTAKTTVARLLAKALNCLGREAPTPEPCNHCDACTAITAGACLDVIEMDAASHRGVADIEEVRKSVGYGPMQFRYKVFIIDEAHQLSSDAKDAFLKTLEEPPANVVFILATTEPQSIPITIRSRCQQFDFKRGSLADIAARLRFVLDGENVGYASEAVNLVARGAEGSWRDALSLLEQVLAFAPTHVRAADVEMVLGTLDATQLGRVTDAVARRDAPLCFALAGELLDAGKEARTLLRTLSAHFRDLLLVSVGGPAVVQELSPEEVGVLQAEAGRFTHGQMLRAMEILNEAQGETRWNNQHRLLVELTFLKLMTLGDAPAQGNGSTTRAAAVMPFVTAPIVYPSAAQQPLPPAPSPGREGAGGRGDEELPATYFASDNEVDADDDEDDYVPPPADEDEPVLAAAFGDNKKATDAEEEDTEPEDTGPGLFDEVDEPALAPPAPSGLGGEGIVGQTVANAPDATSADSELAALMAPGRAGGGAPPAANGSVRTALLAAEQFGEDAAAASVKGVSLDRVVQMWPRFLGDAERFSKRSSVMLAAALPTSVSGKTVTITFTARMNHEMMNQPKTQDFVKKLLAHCLGVDSLAVKFVLDTNVSLPPPSLRGGAKPVRPDRMADLDAALREGPPPVAEAVMAEAAWAPSPPPPPPPPVRGAPPVALAATGLDDPLVQETLSIFGGEIVDD